MPIGAFKLNSISAVISSGGAPSGKTVTLNGGGVISNFGKPGLGRCYSNPTASAYIEVAQHSDFAFGTSQDFTVEGWFYFANHISNDYMFDGRADANSLAILMDGNFLKVYIAGAYRISSISNAVGTNTWVHVAYTRNGTTGTLWLNGQSVGTWTDTTNYTHSNSLKIMSRYVAGQGSAESFCDEFRISKVARYTTTFTPNASGFNGDSDTLLLLHFDETAGSTTTADSSAVTTYTPVTFNYWSITPSAATINEDDGSATGMTYRVTSPTSSGTFYMKYSVAGVDQGTSNPSSDIYLEPTGNLNTNESYVYVSGVADLTTEGNQDLIAYVYSDSGRTNLVATSATTSITDTSISPPSFTYVGQASATASTITIPAIAAVGDIAVLFDFSTTNTQVTPSGFTAINSTGSTGARTTYSYRTLTAGQPGSSITGQAGTTRKIMLVFRPDRTPTTTTAVSNGSQVTTAVPTNQSIALLAAPEPNIAFAVYSFTTSTPTRSWSQTGSTATLTSNISTSGISVYYEINNAGSNPQNATASMGDGGTNILQTCRMLFT